MLIQIAGDVYGRHAYGAVRVTERGKGTLPRLTILRPNRGKRQFSVGALNGHVRSAISGLGKRDEPHLRVMDTASYFISFTHCPSPSLIAAT
jgi:hypothetical protein